MKKFEASREVPGRQTWPKRLQEVDRRDSEFLLSAANWVTTQFCFGQRTSERSFCTRAGKDKYQFIFCFQYNDFYLTLESLSWLPWGAEEYACWRAVTKIKFHREWKVREAFLNAESDLKS